MAGNASETAAVAAGQSQPQIMIGSPKHVEENSVQQSQSTQNSPNSKKATILQQQQNGHNYGGGQPPSFTPIINGAILSNNGQQQQQIQIAMHRVPSYGIASSVASTPQLNSSVGSTPQISPESNLQCAQPGVQKNNHVQAVMTNNGQGQQQQQHHQQQTVLQQVPQQNLFQQQTQQHQSQPQQQMGQAIINPQLLGQQNFSLQQQPMLVPQQMIPQQMLSQPQQQQQGMHQLYQPQLQQPQVAMVQAPILYTTQPAAVAVSTPSSSQNNTPIAKSIKKGRFRVVKPAKQQQQHQQQQHPVGIEQNASVDGQSVMSAVTIETAGEAGITAQQQQQQQTAITTKKKGRFLVKTKSVGVADMAALSPNVITESPGTTTTTTTAIVGDNNTEKSDAPTVAKNNGKVIGNEDAVRDNNDTGGKVPPSSSDKVASTGANNIKKKGRFRVKSGLNLADAESAMSSSDKPTTTDHVRKPSDELRKPSDESDQATRSIQKVASIGEMTTEEVAPATGTVASAPIPSMDGGNMAVPQYTTFIPSMTSYDVNNQVMMVSAPFVTTQNTSMPQFVQQAQIHHQPQQQHPLQIQQQQQITIPAQQPVQNVVASSQQYPPGSPGSHPNSPVPPKGTLQTQPQQVPILQQQQSRSNSPIPKKPSSTSTSTSNWRGISGSYGKNGRLIGCGGVGKVLHNLDSLRQEVLEADKSMTSLQSDNRFLRNKNKELEAKISNLEKRLQEEKALRRSAETKLQTLRQKVKDVGPPPVNKNDKTTQQSEEEVLSDKMNEMASSIASNGKQAGPKVEEEKSTATSAKPKNQTTSVPKPQENKNSNNGQGDSKVQAVITKKGASLSRVEVEPKPKSPELIRRAHTGLPASMSDVDIASLAKPPEATATQFDPLAALDPPPLVAAPTSSTAMAQNFEALVDDNNIAPIPMIVTAQMPTTEGEVKVIENGQHFDPLGTPEKNSPRLVNIQPLVLNNIVQTVPTLTQLNGRMSPTMTTVPVIVPMTTIQIPPQQQQQQQQQDQSKQVGLDPFDEIVCRGQNGE